MHGFSFSAEVRVRFAETDAQGIAHNSNYLVWFEVARVDYLERIAGGCVGTNPNAHSPGRPCRRMTR